MSDEKEKPCPFKEGDIVKLKINCRKHSKFGEYPSDDIGYVIGVFRKGYSEHVWWHIHVVWQKFKHKTRSYSIHRAGRLKIAKKDKK